MCYFFLTVKLSSRNVRFSLVLEGNNFKLFRFCRLPPPLCGLQMILITGANLLLTYKDSESHSASIRSLCFLTASRRYPENGRARFWCSPILDRDDCSWFWCSLVCDRVRNYPFVSFFLFRWHCGGSHLARDVILTFIGFIQSFHLKIIIRNTHSIGVCFIWRHRAIQGSDTVDML